MSDDDSESVSREASPCSESPRPVSLGSESPVDNNIHTSVMTSAAMTSAAMRDHAKVCILYIRFLFVSIHNSFQLFRFKQFTHISFVLFLFLISRFKSFQVTVATQTGHDSPDFAFNPDKMTTDKYCYECKVRYRDPKPQDLVMYLHAWKYQVNEWPRKFCFFFLFYFFEFFSMAFTLELHYFVFAFIFNKVN